MTVPSPVSLACDLTKQSTLAISMALFGRQAPPNGKAPKWALPPPPGVKPGAPDAPYIGDRIIVINAIFIPLTVLFVVVRLYTRLYLTKSFALDDWYLIVATILGFGQNAVTIIREF
jgi:hypothetical protein